MRILFIIMGTVVALATGIGFASANEISFVLTIIGPV